MFPSKADRILSRYRPIAPKLPLPLPLPPPPSAASLATDPSSTCASVDSFASSAKINRRSRKRRCVPATLSAAKCPKTRKSEKPQVVSAVSNNNAGLSASSLSQGNSDGAVPRIDVSYTSSRSYGVHEKGTTPKHNLTMDVSDMRRMALGEPPMVAPHFHPQNLVEQARMFMVVDALKARQPSLSPSLHLRDFPASEVMEKDAAFMERAATSTILPEKGSPAGLSCNSVCMKGAGFAGGGFTEMIRGITRLPTVADVQSLMQARSSTAAGVVGLSPGLSFPTVESRRTSPTPREVHHQRLELQFPRFQASPAACHLIQAPSSVQVDDCTLPLLFNNPPKSPLPPPTLAEDPPVYRGAVPTEQPIDRKKLSDMEGPAVNLSLGNCLDKDLAPSIGNDTLLCEQLSASKHLHKEMGDADAFSLSPPSSSESPHRSLASSRADPPTLSRDGIMVDHAYLQQVYGGSTDPILLVDANNQVLWFNKAYERAFKSVLERLSSQPAATGPYIDPLGHPTPLGSLVLNQADGAFRPVNATLWGFLRKLVMSNVDTTPNLLRSKKLEASRKEKLLENSDTGRLCLSLGGKGPDSIAEESSSILPACRMDDANDAQVCVVGMGKLTTVTLESITEVHAGQGAPVMECVEAAEARLGASGSDPAFITDCTSRVRWVNTDFKQMLGQSEQQNRSTVALAHCTQDTVVKHEPWELIFVGAAEKIPWSAWAFSGLVNLEWMKAGKRRSMTVPCDVSRLAPAATWVWKFDLALGLSLNLCA